MTAVHRLVVALYDQRAGTLERDGGALSFRYDDDYLDSDHPTPLSLSMPLSTNRYTNKYIEAYLRGLLPDNDDVRRRWAAHFGLKDRDTFGLIAAIGSDAAGGAVFLPEPDYLTGMTKGHVEPIDERAIADRLRRLRADSADWLGDDEHWSLAGMQSKFTLHASDSGWGIAHGSEPSTHIVKPGITQIPGQALIEHVSMAALAILGLLVAQTAFTQFEDQQAIVVTRFDRQRRDGIWRRVHQEDLCQTFGLDPSRKYERDGGPGVRRIADWLGMSVTDHGSTERFADAIIANHLLGAPDAHAKNYSILMAGSVVELAPLYDVASGLTSERDGGLRYPKGAMSIGGESAFGDVYSNHWARFAANVGMSEDSIRGRVRTLASALPDAVSDAMSGIPKDRRDEAKLPTFLGRVAHLSSLTLEHLDQDMAGTRPNRIGAVSLVGGRGAPEPTTDADQPGRHEVWG